MTLAEAIAQELGNAEVHPHALDRRNIPGCTYCHPQIASVGLTEAKAKEAGHEVKVGKFPMLANSRAKTNHEPDGFVKIIRGLSPRPGNRYSPKRSDYILPDVFVVLEDEGVDKFEKSWQELLDATQEQLDAAAK